MHGPRDEMSHSITTTTSYVLNKYSRSYPSPCHGTQDISSESEWQHYTNPVMRLILETKRSTSGQLVSMRLRILWSLHTESNDLHIDQRDVVVFEDLELLSFSALSTPQASVAQSDPNLPLKAVYRDAVVGIRYLHPRIVLPGSQPIYRRFQIVFKDVLDALQFIDAIKSVCPCKANPQPTNINRHATTLPGSLVRATTAVLRPVPAGVRSTGLTECRNIISTSVVSPVESVPLSGIPGHLPENQAFSVAPSSAATSLSLSSDDSAFVTCSETPHGSDPLMDHRKGDLSETRRRASDLARSSLPNSSQPLSSSSSSSSDQILPMPPPPVPRRVTQSVATEESPSMQNTGNERSQLLVSLSKRPSLYGLSRIDLETLVGQIVREEGFLDLLESLDSLWTVKGFLGR